MKSLLMFGPLFIGLLLGCSKSPDEITLNLSSSVSGVDRYIYILQTDANSTSGRIYPDKCTDAGQTPACYRLKTCGYLATSSTVKPQLPFSDFDKNASLTLRVCGVNTSGVVVASGQTSFTNTGNETVALTLAGNASACALLSPLCP